MREKQSLRRLIGTSLLCLALFTALGCDNVEPQLYGTPTPSASPTPLPDAFTAEITAEPVPTDTLGKVIEGDAHYFSYLSFGELRVYEYDNGTFLDGVCINGFPTALDGQVDIVYYTADGKLCGSGTIHNAQGTTRLESGINAIYAEINTDIDVRMMDFSLEVKQVFLPVTEEPTDEAP